MRSPPPLPRGEGALRRHRLPPVRNTWAGFEGGVRSPQFFPWDGRSPVSHPTCDVPFPPRRRHAIPTDSLPLSDRQASFGDAENDPRRGRGCIHRTSSTRQSSAAQVARTHFPTRASQVQTISWSKLRRRSTRPPVQDNHNAVRQRQQLSSRRNLPVFARGSGFQRGDICCPWNPGAQEVRVHECVCAGERSMLAGHEIPLNSEPKT